MNRIYQWLSGRASFFRSDASGRGTSRTVRTEVTVERQGTTLLMGGAGMRFDLCPFCGQKLAPEQAGPARLRLQTGSISQEDLPLDGTSRD
ncbi:MAG: hypothetical protein WBQ43_12765 [Terriglobales bacterium]